MQFDVDRPDTSPYLPTGQALVQLAFDIAVVFPKRPGTQSVHTPAPAKLYLPREHVNAVALTEPSTHAYPAVQAAVQLEVLIPVELPKRPAGQRVHTSAPARLYRPAGQIEAVADTDPAMHA